VPGNIEGGKLSRSAPSPRRLWAYWAGPVSGSLIAGKTAVVKLAEVLHLQFRQWGEEIVQMALAGRFFYGVRTSKHEFTGFFKKYLAGLLDGRSRSNNAIYLPGGQSTVGLLSEISTVGEGLRGAGVRELMSQAAAKSARFGKDFFCGPVY